MLFRRNSKYIHTILNLETIFQIEDDLPPNVIAHRTTEI